MSILVKGNITITKGFDTWKKMVHEQDGKLCELLEPLRVRKKS